MAVSSLCAALLALAQFAPARTEVPSRSPRAAGPDAEGRTTAAASVETTPAARVAPFAAVPIGHPSRERSDARPMQTVRAGVSFDEASGTLWARGENYKLSFERGTVRFVPFLASFAPRNFEVAFSMRSVSCAGERLAFDADARATRDGNAVELDRGVLRERYECEPREVEQTFTFDALVARGELVIELDAATDLSVRPSNSGFELSNEFGSVAYGRATALDAAGRALELESTWTNGLLTITVPREFVASAALPLVVDPILASFGIEATPADSFAPDVSFDANGTAVLYCWESEFSANDHDVWADVYDAAGNPLYAGGWIDMTSTWWGRPRSANLAASNRFLVAAHTINATTGRVEVWARTRSVTVALLSAQFKVAGGSSYDVLDPDVGGDPYPTSPSFFCVVYERVYGFGVDHDVHAKLVTDAGTLATGALGVDVSVNTYDSLPSISKSDNSSAWNVAWQRASPAGGNDVFGARIDWDGVVSAPTFAIAVGPADHTRPAVSPCAENSNLWVCAYEEDFGTDHDIIATGLDGATIRRTIDLSSFDGAYWYQDQRFPSLDSDGVHFACSYSELYQQSATDYDVYASEILFNGVSMSAIEAHQPVFQTDGAEIEAQIASIESSRPAQSSHDYVIAWHREPDFYVSSSDDVLGATYRGNPGGQVASFCDGASVSCPCGNGSSTSGGCPNSVQPSGALLTWSGQAATSADTLQFVCSGMPASSTCLFFQGANATNGSTGVTFGDGVRCAGSPMIRLGLKTASVAGAALYPAAGDLSITSKGQVPPSGATLLYQVWYRNPAAFCTPSTTNLSNALVVAWTP